jgi:hypothetical protein
MGSNFSTGRAYAGSFGGTGGRGGAGGGSGGVRRDAEVEAANRGVAGGGNVGQAIARVQNAGGGEVKIPADKLKDAMDLTTRKIAVGPGGAILLDTRAISTDGLKGDVKMYDRNGKEMKMERTVTAQVVENGVSGFRMGTSNFTFQPVRQKVELTDAQRSAVLTANLPPQLSGMRFNEKGQINGFKINPELVPDKAVRNYLYSNTGRDMTMRFTPDSPVGKALQGQLAQGGIDFNKWKSELGLKD